MIIMENYSRSGVHDFTMASRKAEETMWLVVSVEDAYNFMMNWLTKAPTVYGIFHSKRKLCW
ncbi:unnamed protein product [Trifolium pratense]|uniref:Uncharacterized protein n=1 Tax=Trifolium pratense TaxID=57577 RepID=A0ACB0LDA7_TRIPR|nr:unnamed protein product [Trifolium pratense]